MSDVKATVSSNYMEETKAKLLTNPHPPESRNVLIVGGTDDNIGGAIARSLPPHYKFMLTQFDAGKLRELWDLDEYDTVVFVNGESHLDWIENQPNGKIESAIYNSLTASVLGTGDFVRETIDHPHKKHIVYIGSMAYRNVLNGSAPYCAAKARLAMFTRCMAWELAPKNYDVFAVHPSNTEGMPMSEKTIEGLMRYRDMTREQAEAYWGASLPKERWLQGDDIGEVVRFLISGNATYMSGSNVELTGGQR